MRWCFYSCCVLAVALAAGCDYESRLKTLEKENQELKEQVKRQNASADLDAQAKCSKDGKAWFDFNWGSPSGEMLLTYTNHYSKSENKCFILVEYHHSVDKKSGSWNNDITLWNVYENSKYGTFSENHMMYFKPEVRSVDSVWTCEVLDKKCKTIDEFNGLIQPYLYD